MKWSGSESDDVLVDGAKSAVSGDVRAFELLMQRHQSRVLANCRYLTGSADDAQDLAQEVFVKAYFALSKFEGRSQFKTWISSIKVNHCLNFLRKKKGKSFLDVQAPELEPEPALHAPATAERDVTAGTQARRIQEILDDMPDTLRVPLVLRELDGLSYQEIAERLSLGLSAVKMRIKRARDEFRSRYAALSEEPTAAPKQADGSLE